MTAARSRSRAPAWFWMAAALALAAVIAGAAIAVVAYTSGSDPATVVRDYFAALRRGDAPAALALGTVPAGPRNLLTSAVLAEQQRLAPIAGVTVIDTAQRGSRASVTVGYRLARPGGAAQHETDMIELRKRDGRWALDRTAVPIELRLLQAKDRASILGAPVPAGTTLLFPGAVPVAFDTPYLRLADGGATVGFGATGTLDLRVEVSPAGEKAIDTAVATQLATCARPDADPRCPLPSDRYVPGSLRGSVPGDLSSRLTLQVGSDARGSVGITGRVIFRGAWRSLSFENVASQHDGEVALPVAASVSVVPALHLTWRQTS